MYALPHQFPAVPSINGVSACFPSFAGFQLFSFSYWGWCPFHSSVSSCSPSVIWVSACFLQRFPAILFQSSAFSFKSVPKLRGMLPRKCDMICWYIACSQILFCIFYLLQHPLLELDSKSTSLSTGFSDVIKAVRYDLLILCLISWQGLFLEMWGGWMLSSDVAGVMQEAGDACSRARTWSQV